MTHIRGGLTQRPARGVKLRETNMNTVSAAIFALAAGMLVAGCTVPMDGPNAGTASTTQAGGTDPNRGGGGGGGGGMGGGGGGGY